MEPVPEKEWKRMMGNAQKHSVDLEPAMRDGVSVTITRAPERYDAILDELEFEDE